MTDPVEWISFDCIKVMQPIGEFYVGSMESQDVVFISHADVRRLENRELDRYLGFERPLRINRVNELRKYVALIDAAFPTSIILALKSDDVQYDESNKTMKIRRRTEAGTVIDGQHRIEGLRDYAGPRFDLNVTIFVDMDIEDQAMVFGTINLEQTKVPKSHVIDLFELARLPSPHKTCHSIARLLNSRKESPFYRRIKILGVATEPEQTITQATFVSRLLEYVSDDPQADRDLIKRGKWPSLLPSDSERLVFRGLFLEKKDAVIARVVWDYFCEVRNRWPSAWERVERGMILNRTTGFAAFMRALRLFYLRARNADASIDSPKLEKLLQKIQLEDADFNSQKFPPGGSGEAALFKLLKETLREA